MQQNSSYSIGYKDNLTFPMFNRFPKYDWSTLNLYRKILYGGFGWCLLAKKLWLQNDVDSLEVWDMLKPKSQFICNFWAQVLLEMDIVIAISVKSFQSNGGWWVGKVNRSNVRESSRKRVLGGNFLLFKHKISHVFWAHLNESLYDFNLGGWPIKSNLERRVNQI